jgi:hypothetical protein
MFRMPSGICDHRRFHDYALKGKKETIYLHRIHDLTGEHNDVC